MSHGNVQRKGKPGRPRGGRYVTSARAPGFLEFLDNATRTYKSAPRSASGGAAAARLGSVGLCGHSCGAGASHLRPGGLGPGVSLPRGWCLLSQGAWCLVPTVCGCWWCRELAAGPGAPAGRGWNFLCSQQVRPQAPGGQDGGRRRLPSPGLPGLLRSRAWEFGACGAAGPPQISRAGHLSPVGRVTRGPGLDRAFGEQPGKVPPSVSAASSSRGHPEGPSLTGGEQRRNTNVLALPAVYRKRRPHPLRSPAFSKVGAAGMGAPPLRAGPPLVRPTAEHTFPPVLSAAAPPVAGVVPCAPHDQARRRDTPWIR